MYGTVLIFQQTRVYPYPLGAGSARPNPKMGAPDPENPLFLVFSVLRGGLRPWSQTMVSEGARPWGRVDPETFNFRVRKVRKFRDDFYFRVAEMRHPEGPKPEKELTLACSPAAFRPRLMFSLLILKNV